MFRKSVFRINLFTFATDNHNLNIITHSMKKFLFVLAVAILGTQFTGCNKKKTETEVEHSDSTAVAITPIDSTLYGTSGEFGMSTFTLITDKGDTLYVTRDHEDGSMAQIYGSTDYDQRYAMTTCDNGESIDVLINLSELEKFLKSYKIVNGALFVNDDSMQIVQLCDDSLTLRNCKNNEFKTYK